MDLLKDQTVPSVSELQYSTVQYSTETVQYIMTRYFSGLVKQWADLDGDRLHILLLLFLYVLQG